MGFLGLGSTKLGFLVEVSLQLLELFSDGNELLVGLRFCLFQLLKGLVGFRWVFLEVLDFVLQTGGLQCLGSGLFLGSIELVVQPLNSFLEVLHFVILLFKQEIVILFRDDRG